MGQAVDFAERNDFIGKPRDMTDNQCYALPVCRLVTHIPGPTDQDKATKTHAHISFWQFTDEEVEEIVKNRGAFVRIIGTSTYPFSVHGKKPIYVDESELSDKVFTKEEVIAIKGGN